MQYKVFSKKIIVRIDKGEEICEQLKAICEKEGVRLASVSAIGAVSEFTVGVFNAHAKQYKANNFTGNYEIVTLLGTVTEQNGAFYSHLHMSAADENGRVFGGHLNTATVSATCEMVIDIADGRVDRKFSQEVGLNLLEF